MAIRVIVNGANGKMGKIAVSAVNESSDLTLVAQTGRHDNLADVIQRHQAEVVIDFTTPETVFANAQVIIQAGARPVIGTTGLTPPQIETLTLLCAQKKLGGIIAPNFSWERS